MSSIPQRTEVPAADRWDLSTLYTDDQQWEADLKRLGEYEQRIAAYRGRLAESADTLVEYLRLSVEVGTLEERLGYYAMLRQSEDAGDSDNQSRFGRFMQVSSRVSTAMSFFAPELQQIPDERIQQLRSDPRLEEFAVTLDKVLRYRPYTLGPQEEKLLAMQEEANQTASKAFGALVDVDMDFGTVDTPEGPRPLSQSSFGSLLEHRAQ